MISRELQELLEEIEAGPHREFFGVNLLPLVHQLRTLAAESVLLADGIKQAHDAVIVERRKCAELKAERKHYREGLSKIITEGSYPGAYPGEKILANIAFETLEART